MFQRKIGQSNHQFQTNFSENLRKRLCHYEISFNEREKKHNEQ